MISPFSFLSRENSIRPVLFAWGLFYGIVGMIDSNTSFLTSNSVWVHVETILSTWLTLSLLVFAMKSLAAAIAQVKYMTERMNREGLERAHYTLSIFEGFRVRDERIDELERRATQNFDFIKAESMVEKPNRKKKV